MSRKNVTKLLTGKAGIAMAIGISNTAIKLAA